MIKVSTMDKGKDTGTHGSIRCGIECIRDGGCHGMFEGKRSNASLLRVYTVLYRV